MSDERRYGDDEVSRIFETATTTPPARSRAVAAREGLTLAELQSIGGEVGIAPERIAEAAAALERGGAPARRRTQLGLPVSVGRTVELPHAPTDREWQLLLAELRETFGAHGKDRSSGDLRAWTNGNLHAYVEPTEAGHRLRLGTTKGNGLAINRMGMVMMLVALALFLVAMATGGTTDDIELAGMLGLIGVGALGANALRLPGWAREREEQMEHIAARARALIRPAPEPGAGEDAGQS